MKHTVTPEPTLNAEPCRTFIVDGHLYLNYGDSSIMRPAQISNDSPPFVLRGSKQKPEPNVVCTCGNDQFTVRQPAGQHETWIACTDCKKEALVHDG